MLTLVHPSYVCNLTAFLTRDQLCSMFRFCQGSRSTTQQQQQQQHHSQEKKKKKQNIDELEDITTHNLTSLIYSPHNLLLFYILLYYYNWHCVFKRAAAYFFAALLQYMQQHTSSTYTTTQLRAWTTEVNLIVFQLAKVVSAVWGILCFQFNQARQRWMEEHLRTSSIDSVFLWILPVSFQYPEIKAKEEKLPSISLNFQEN